jgi:hypothetical protein
LGGFQFRFIFFLALVFSLTISANGSRAQPLPKGTLSGNVVSAKGKPIANVRVWAKIDDNKLLAEGRTNADGHFRLGPVEPVYRHRFDLFFEADGFARQYVPGQTYSIFPGTDCEIGMMRMDRGRTYVGQVVDVDGTPRPGATVECEAHRYEMGHTIGTFMSQKVKTDADGFFRSPPMPVGYLSFTCRHPERRLAYHSLLTKLPGGEETLAPIRLEKDVPIHGTVKDEKGKPLGGVKINASGTQSISDSGGRFTLRGFGPEPSFQLQAFKDGHEWINWGVKVTKEGIQLLNVYEEKAKFRAPVKELTLVMTTLPWIEGRAVDAITGDAVPIEKVVLCQLERKPNGEVERRG